MFLIILTLLETIQESIKLSFSTFFGLERSVVCLYCIWPSVTLNYLFSLSGRKKCRWCFWRTTGWEYKVCLKGELDFLEKNLLARERNGLVPFKTYLYSPLIPERCKAELLIMTKFLSSWILEVQCGPVTPCVSLLCDNSSFIEIYELVRYFTWFLKIILIPYCLILYFRDLEIVSNVLRFFLLQVTANPLQPNVKSKTQEKQMRSCLITWLRSLSVQQSPDTAGFWAKKKLFCCHTPWSKMTAEWKDCLLF